MPQQSLPCVHASMYNIGIFRNIPRMIVVLEIGYICESITQLPHYGTIFVHMCLLYAHAQMSSLLLLRKRDVI